MAVERGNQSQNQNRNRNNGRRHSNEEAMFSDFAAVSEHMASSKSSTKAVSTAEAINMTTSTPTPRTPVAATKPAAQTTNQPSPAKAAVDTKAEHAGVAKSHVPRTVEPAKAEVVSKDIVIISAPAIDVHAHAAAPTQKETSAMVDDTAKPKKVRKEKVEKVAAPSQPSPLKHLLAIFTPGNLTFAKRHKKVKKTDPVVDAQVDAFLASEKKKKQDAKLVEKTKQQTKAQKTLDKAQRALDKATSKVAAHA